MDLSRLGLDRLNVEFKDLRSGNMNQQSFAEIILIDRSSSESSQTCYLLKNDRIFNQEEFETYKQVFYNFDKNDFHPVGEVLSIDKSSKTIILKDQNSISYNHLIIASGSHYSMINYEFLAGVHTLVDAMRVRKKIPSAFYKAFKSTPVEKRKMKSAKTSSKDFNFPKKIDNLKARKMLKMQLNESSNTLNTTKRLYEVQI